MKETKRSLKKLLLSLAGIEIIAYLIACLLMLLAFYLSLQGVSYTIIYSIGFFTLVALITFLHFRDRKARK